MSNPLAQLSLLLNLKIRKWAGEVSDKKALGAVAKAFGGDTHRDKYRKSLFVTNALEAIDKCAGRIRLNFYKWTMAWLDGGLGRLVSSMDYRDFAVEHRGLVNEFEQEVDRFIQDYPDHKAAAKERKGDLYNEHEYPSQSELRDRFAIELTTLPFPDNSDFRVAAPESIIDELRRSVDESIDAVVHNVEEDIRNRVIERVGMLRDGLGSGKRWSRTLFEELGFVTNMGIHMQEILPKKLGKDLVFIQDHITSADPNKLRHSDTGKETCLKACESVLKSLQT
jgi:hypothetical protein